MKVYIYIHIFVKNNWKDVFKNISKNIKLSGLYNRTKLIKCFFIGDLNKSEIQLDPKIKAIINKDQNLLEKYTLQNLYNDSCKKNFYVLYLHSKGVTKPDNKMIKDWLNYMLYFNLYKWETILKYLKKYDTVGVNLKGRPFLHYSGNFWWSKSSYIRKLDRNIDVLLLKQNKGWWRKKYNYYSSEYWVTCSNMYTPYDRKCLSLYSSGVNHYKEYYKKDKYKGKEITPYVLKKYDVKKYVKN